MGELGSAGGDGGDYQGGDPKFNPTLAAAFFRFLVKSAAENSVTKLAAMVASLQEDLRKWDVPGMKRDLTRLKK